MNNVEISVLCCHRLYRFFLAYMLDSTVAQGGCGMCSGTAGFHGYQIANGAGGMRWGASDERETAFG